MEKDVVERKVVGVFVVGCWVVGRSGEGEEVVKDKVVCERKVVGAVVFKYKGHPEEQLHNPKA